MTNNKLLWAAWFLAAAPLFLNDVVYLFITSYEVFVFIDYACRIISFIPIVYLLAYNKLRLHDIGFSYTSKDQILFWTLIIGTMSLYLAYMFNRTVYLFMPIDWLWMHPIQYDCTSFIFKFDYYLGLLFVAFHEETLARGYASAIIKKTSLHVIPGTILFSLLFALFHWSSSPLNMIWCFVFSIIYMIPTYRTQNILPATVGHYIVNLVTTQCN